MKLIIFIAGIIALTVFNTLLVAPIISTYFPEHTLAILFVWSLVIGVAYGWFMVRRLKRNY